jgi:hypothetical protein
VSYCGRAGPLRAASAIVTDLNEPMLQSRRIVRVKTSAFRGCRRMGSLALLPDRSLHAEAQEGHQRDLPGDFSIRPNDAGTLAALKAHCCDFVDPAC